MEDYQLALVCFFSSYHSPQFVCLLVHYFLPDAWAYRAQIFGGNEGHPRMVLGTICLLNVSVKPYSDCWAGFFLQDFL